MLDKRLLRRKLADVVARNHRQFNSARLYRIWVTRLLRAPATYLALLLSNKLFPFFVARESSHQRPQFSQLLVRLLASLSFCLTLRSSSLFLSFLFSFIFLSLTALQLSGLLATIAILGHSPLRCSVLWLTGCSIYIYFYVDLDASDASCRPPFNHREIVILINRSLSLSLWLVRKFVHHLHKSRFYTRPFPYTFLNGKKLVHEVLNDVKLTRSMPRLDKPKSLGSPYSRRVSFFTSIKQRPKKSSSFFFFIVERKKINTICYSHEMKPLITQPNWSAMTNYAISC